MERVNDKADLTTLASHDIALGEPGEALHLRARRVSHPEESRKG